MLAFFFKTKRLNGFRENTEENFENVIFSQKHTCDHFREIFWNALLKTNRIQIERNNPRSKQSLWYGGLVNISKLVLFESIHVKKLPLYAFSTAPLYMKVIIRAESHKFSRVSTIFCISAAYWLRSSICNRGLIMMRKLFVHKNKWTKKMGVQLELKFKMASENCPCSLFLSHWLFLFLFLAQSQCASITKEIS